MDAPAGYVFRDELNAKRLHEHIHAARMAVGLVPLVELRAAGQRRYIALTLEECTWDGVIYETRTDAMRHQRGNANHYLYPELPLEHWGEPVCDVLLNYWRTVYKNQGYRPAGAHDGAALILPQRIEDIL